MTTVMAAQLVNTLKTTELYNLNGYSLCYVNYISTKLLKSNYILLIIFNSKMLYQEAQISDQYFDLWSPSRFF